VLREVFGSERDKVTGDWRKQYNEALHDLCCSPDVVWVIRSRGAGQCFVGGTDGKRLLVRPRRKWEVTSNVSQITGLLERVLDQ
jgi:hypothetical protein